MIVRKKISRIVKSLTAPVEAELPFFGLFLLAVAFQSLCHFPTPLMQGNMEPLIYFFKDNFPRAVFIAYLFTLLVHYSRSRAVRIGCYAFGTVLFGLCLFLQCVFGKTLQPNIIMLIAETNPQESSEFLRSFLFSAGGIATLLGLAAYIAAIFLLERRRAQLSLCWGKAGCRRPVNLALLAFAALGLVQCRIFKRVANTERIEKVDLWGLEARDGVTSLFYSLYSVILVNQQMKHAVAVTLAATPPYMQTAGMTRSMWSM